MPKLCVFAGTTEGREIAEFLAEQSADVTVCVATEYGETLLPQGEGLHISARPLPREEMAELFRRERFDLVIDTVRRLPQLGNRGAYLVQKMNDKLVEHRQYIKDNGIDLPEVRAWKWNDGKGIES